MNIADILSFSPITRLEISTALINSTISIKDTISEEDKEYLVTLLRELLIVHLNRIGLEVLKLTPDEQLATRLKESENTNDYLKKDIENLNKTLLDNASLKDTEIRDLKIQLEQTIQAKELDIKNLINEKHLLEEKLYNNFTTLATNILMAEAQNLPFYQRENFVTAEKIKTLAGELSKQ